METPPIPGAREGMRELFAAHNIAIITARPPESDPWTKEWLALKEIPYDAYENLRDGEKHQTTMRCDVLIDDYQVNVLNFLRGTSGHAVLYSQPWNWDHGELESFIESKRLRLALDWREVVSLISTLIPHGAATLSDAKRS